MSILYDFAFIFVALFALGFTIFIHELGHFLAARQRGLVILRFSIGFGPKHDQKMLKNESEIEFR